MSKELAKETAEKMLRLLEEAWQQGHDETITALRSEPVTLQFRHKETNEHTVNFGKFSPWETCSEAKYAEIKEYISQGYSYEVRELYAAPSREDHKESSGAMRSTVDLSKASTPEPDNRNRHPSRTDRQEPGLSAKQISLEGGKYIFHKEPDGAVYCKRHGEPWRTFIGDHAVTALFDMAMSSLRGTFADGIEAAAKVLPEIRRRKFDDCVYQEGWRDSLDVVEGQIIALKGGRHD